MKALSKFLIAYLVQVGTFWLFIKILISKDELKNELGVYWYLFVFILPMITSIAILYFTHKNEKKSQKPKPGFDNIDFLKEFGRNKKLNKEEISYFHETKDNWALAIYPPNLLSSSSSDLEIPKAFFGFVKLIYYFTKFIPFWHKKEIPTPVYFAITNFRILYRHRYVETDKVKSIDLKNIEAPNDIQLINNKINGLPQVVEI
ncbi:MAG: hypothetical protein AAGA77_25030 [Bacteroidota bacterium]